MKEPIHSGRRCDRATRLRQKLPLFRELGFGAVLFHDDDVPDLNDLAPSQIRERAR